MDLPRLWLVELRETPLEYPLKAPFLKAVKLKSSSIGEFERIIISSEMEIIEFGTVEGSIMILEVVPVPPIFKPVPPLQLALYSSLTKWSTRRIIFPTANSIGWALIILAAISRINWMREAAVDHRLLLMTVLNKLAVSIAVLFDPVICLWEIKNKHHFRGIFYEFTFFSVETRNYRHSGSLTDYGKGSDPGSWV